MPQANATVKIIGVDMFVGSNSDFTASLIESVNEKKSFQKNRLISATSAHGMVFANENAEFKKIISAFYLNLPDGQPTAWIGRLKGFKNMKRCPGVGLFDTVIRNTATHSIQHFFLKHLFRSVFSKHCLEPHSIYGVGIRILHRQILYVFQCKKLTLYHQDNFCVPRNILFLEGSLQL